MSYEPPALFVAWRDPETRRIYAVGRLLRLVGTFRGYEFGYIEGARVATEVGFQPFLAFPKLDQVYRSRELLPFFQNRVLSPARPDYPEYVESLALDAGVAEPLTLLAVSGGRRATDLVEIFPDWTLEGTGERIQTRLLVRGVQHVPGAEERIARLQSGEALHGVRDRENPINPQAIRLRTEDGIDIGFVPDYLAADLTRLLDNGAEIDVRVQRVNPPPVPRHHRVLCVLSTRAGVGVAGYRGETFRPISSDATDIEDRVTTPAPPAVVAGL
ncbi:MAG: HIRAN domain-containing protein [Deltaproteobacteria bacterium]